MNNNFEKFKERILFIGGSYPVYGPNGRIAMQYLDLLKKNYEVYVICYNLNSLNYQEIKNDGITVITLFNWRLHCIAYFKRKMNYSSLFYAKYFFYLCTIFFRAIGRIQAFVLWPDNLRWFYLKSYKKAQELHCKLSFDLIISICNPFTAHLSGLKFVQSNPYVKWISITFDPVMTASLYRRSYVIPALKRKLNNRAERKIFEKSDFILLTREISNTNPELSRQYQGKIDIIEYLLEENTCDQGSLFFDEEKIYLVFAGTLYKSIRNPECLLKTILQINNTKIQLHLFITSGCESIVRRLAQKSNGSIVIHAPVDASEIKSIYRKANVLVNIGNSDPSFKPSKLFEYISTGKPIINFFKNGIIDNVLQKYPLSLQIDCDKTTIVEAAELVEKFCLEYKDEEISWVNVKGMFPEHDVEAIRNVLFKSIEVAKKDK